MIEQTIFFSPLALRCVEVPLYDGVRRERKLLTMMSMSVAG